MRLKSPLFILILASLIPVHARAEIVDKIVATVDNQGITESDIAKAQKQAGRPLSRQQVLQTLVNEKILLQELEKSDIKVSDGDVEAAIRDILTRKQISREALEKGLREKGVSWNQYTESLRLELKHNKFMQTQIYPRIRIADYDLQQYYDRNKSQFQGYGKVRFLEIFLTPDSIPPGSNIVDFTKQLMARLQNGESFEKMALQYSKGPFAKQGGNSGLIDTTSLRPDLKEFLMTSKIGTMTNPLPSPDGSGIFIFKVVEKQNPIDRPFAEVKEVIRRQVADASVDDELEKYLMEARSRHFVQIKD